MIMDTCLGLCLSVHAHPAYQLLNHGSISLRQDVQNASLNNARHLFLIRFKCLSGAFSLSDTNNLVLLVNLDNVAFVLIRLQARRPNDRGSISGRQVCRGGDCVRNWFAKLCDD